MQVRHWLSVLSVFFLAATVGLAGNPVVDPYQKGDSQLGDSGSDLSDPINLSTGEFVLEQTDLHIPGRGLDFEIKRTYRSYAGLLINEGWGTGPWDLVNVDFETPVGDHWDFNYNMRISFSEPEPIDPVIIEGPIPTNQLRPPSIIDVFPGTSRADQFRRYTTGVYNPVDYYSNTESNFRVELTLIDEPIYITDENKTVYKFFAGYPANPNDAVFAGRLESITDRNGNQILFTWEEVGTYYARIDYVTDTLGHHIEFYYYGDNNDELFRGQSSPTGASAFQSYERQQLIWAIEDHAGRAVEYNYTKAHSTSVLQLTSVILPAIEADSNGNFQLPLEHERFPGGREWQYTYDTENRLGKWDDLMLATITSPNGDVVLQNDYDVSLYDDRNDGRVLRQVYGDGVFNYVVTTLSGSTDLSYSWPELNDDDYYVWVNDRRGAITRLKYAGAANTVAKHRQLIERVEYEGFFSDKDASIFGTVNIATGEVTAWNKLDVSDFDHNSVILPGGPSLSDGTPTTEKYVHSWETNATWSPTACYAPGGDSVTLGDRVIYSRVGDGNSDDPRAWGSMTSRTEYSVSYNPGAIVEQWAYNFDVNGDGGWGAGFETGYKDGNGNVTIKKYDVTPDPLTGRANGNMLFKYHGLTNPDIDANPDMLGEANTSAIDEYTYNEWGQVLTHKHPAKRILNASGIEEPHHRVDQFEYYNNPLDEDNYGRLHKKHVDINDFNLTTTFEYDAIGNIIKKNHPDGDVSEYIYNQEPQLVREQHFDDGGVSRELFAQTDYFYDANGYLVRKEILNLAGEPPVVQSNQSITTVYAYDMHGYRTHTSREHGDFSGVIGEIDSVSRKAAVPVGDSDFATEQWFFDESKNLEKFLYGQALNQSQGPQVNNFVEYDYNARDLIIKKKQGDGIGVGETRVTSALYDDRGRLSSVYVNQGSVGYEQHHIVQFDGFDRVVWYSDPMGNKMNFEYDNNGNVIELYFSGPVAFDSTSDPEIGFTLYSESYSYDNMDRMAIRSLDIFDYDYIAGTGPASGSGPHGSSQQVVSYIFNRDSSVYSVSESSGDVSTDKLTTSFYDTIGRLDILEDNDFNTTQYAYDSQSNTELITRTEQSTLLGGSSETYIVGQVFDSLDRLIRSTDGAGNQTSFEFDSRFNMTKRIDPRGNINKYFFDGMNRLTKSQVQMTVTGDGTGAPLVGDDEYITTEKFYDDSSRLIADKDDAGNITLYTHDGLNRISTTRMPDNAVYSNSYDGNGNMVVHTDARGLVITHEYDLNNRLSKRFVDGVEIESYKFDGLGRVREAVNAFSKITREYDSRSNVTRETQNVDVASGFSSSYDRVVEYAFDDANNTSQIVYPNGRVIDRAYDHLNRLLVISDPVLSIPVTQFEYVGNRTQRRIHGNNTRTGYEYSGYQGGLVNVDNHGFGRMSKITTSKAGTGEVLDSFDFTWDESQNRTGYKDSGSGMDNRRERLFGYDSSNRLVSSSVDYPSTSSTKIDDATSYVFDDDHNRLDVSESLPSGEGDAGAGLGIYGLNGDHALNNQYSVTPREDGSEWAYQYDANGNMILMALNVVADFTGDYSLDFFDISAFLEAFGNEDPAADFNGDGSFDFFDTQAFLLEFGAYPSGGFANRHYTYNFRNQLTSVEFRTGPTVVDYLVMNTYDPFARRVTETITDNMGMDSSRQMVYGCDSLWEVIEQIDLDSGQTLTTHVFGLGIDDEVGYRVENASAPEKDIWTHRDDLGSLTSITDSNGDVLERYEYGDYGLVTIMDASGVARLSSMHNAFHLYTGRPLIAGTGLQDSRYRVLDPVTGKFIQRDPLLYVDSMNAYSYVSNSPYVYTDPSGLSITLLIKITKGLGNLMGVDRKNVIALIVQETFGTLEDAYKLNASRNCGNVNMPKDPDEADRDGFEPKKSDFHRASDPDNEKWVHPDGREIVFDGDGNVVTDPRDRGTFNYATNEDSSTGHMLMDVLPWLLWGTGPDDPSTYQDRVNMMDDAANEGSHGVYGWLF